MGDGRDVLDHGHFCLLYTSCLKRANINTVEDLISKTEDEMMKVRNLGRKSLEGTNVCFSCGVVV